jgi:hypothetical protein
MVVYDHVLDQNPWNHLCKLRGKILYKNWRAILTHRGTYMKYSATGWIRTVHQNRVRSQWARRERLALCVNDLTAKTSDPHPLVNLVTGRVPSRLRLSLIGGPRRSWSQGLKPMISENIHFLDMINFPCTHDQVLWSSTINSTWSRTRSSLKFVWIIFIKRNREIGSWQVSPVKVRKVASLTKSQSAVITKEGLQLSHVFSPWWFV